MPNRLRVFEAHGVVFTGTCDDEVYGRCPFSGKADKFYVNTQTLLWDSKTAGLSGNVNRFLEEIAKVYNNQMTPQLLRTLAEDRQLPESAFRGWHVGWTGTHYTIPVFNAGGTCTDIRMYRIGQGAMATPGASIGLLGATELTAHPDEDVYLCEGEWDTIALRWLLRKLKLPGVVVGVPGATVFKQDWIPWFSGRHVFTLYDNDEPGENGELMAMRRLQSVAQSVMFTHWPNELKTGFDVRDWVIAGAIERNEPLKCYQALTQLFRAKPRKTVLGEGGTAKAGMPNRRATDPPEASPNVGGNGHVKTHWAKPPSYDDVVRTFKKWLYLDSTDILKVVFATVVSQVLDGPPVWVFIVGPPGSAKTETLTALAGLPFTYMTSSLTPHALISGANWKDNVDPSLIPRWDGKVAVIKDFTSILTLRDAEKDEIFGILREAYDGRCGKVFGTGIERRYESRFTVLAAVTPTIYALSSQHTSLGERFLKFSVGDNLKHTSEMDIISRAIDNIDHDTKMKAELADVSVAFLTRRLDLAYIKTHSPTIPDSIKTRIVYLARFGARLRGTVSRDAYRNEIITSRPSAEVGSRLGIQLAKLAKALAAVDQRSSVNEDDYRILKKVILDTIPQRTEDLLRCLVMTCPTLNDRITAQDLSATTRYPIATVIRILQDLNILDVVSRYGTTYKYTWSISDYIRECLKEARLYQTEDELNRPMRLWARVRRSRKSSLTEKGSWR